jgi:hypothetical protein
LSVDVGLVSRLERYRNWRDDPVFLTFEKLVAPVGVNPVAHWDRPGPGAVRVLPEGVTRERIVVKGSKRGNDVYSQALNRRISRWLRSVSVPVRFWPFWKRRVRGSWLMMTYTLDRSLFSLEEGWRKIREVSNRHLSWLRKRFGQLRYVSVLQAQSDGYAHLHFVVEFLNHRFAGFRHVDRDGRLSWRVSEKYDIAENWASGHVDVKLVQSLKGDLWYLAKYLVRSADSVKGELGMALSRDFGRRVWSKSRSWPGVDSIRNSGNSNSSVPDLSQVRVIVPTDPLRSLYSRCVIVKWWFEGVQYTPHIGDAG